MVAEQIQVFHVPRYPRRSPYSPQELTEVNLPACALKERRGAVAILQGGGVGWGGEGPDEAGVQARRGLNVRQKTGLR